MIYDRMTELRAYKGISRNLDTALEYLATADLAVLPEGKHPIDGDRVIVNVQLYETKKRAEARYEAHLNYIDIQLVLEGRELCYCVPLSSVSPAEPFIEERDIGFYGDPSEPDVALPLTPGRFAVFFPHDAHVPSCDAGGASRNRKIVVKVAV